jgi:hypothetical protein
MNFRIGLRFYRDIFRISKNAMLMLKLFKREDKTTPSYEKHLGNKNIEIHK